MMKTTYSHVMLGCVAPVSENYSTESDYDLLFFILLLSFHLKSPVSEKNLLLLIARIVGWLWRVKMVVFEKKYKWSAAGDQDNSLGDEVSQRTLKCVGVSEKAEKKILYELFLNAGPLEKVTIPRDRVTGQQLSVAYILFCHPESVKYAFSLLNGTVLYGQQLRLQHRASGLGIGKTYKAVGGE